jgi:hypothetical protein
MWLLSLANSILATTLKKEWQLNQEMNYTDVIKTDSKYKLEQPPRTQPQNVYIDLIVLAITNIDRYEEKML